MNKVQKIDCFCGKSFDFDWSKIPDTEKIIYMRCPNCDSELKRGNPYYINSDIINQSKVINITRDNYKDFDWNEDIKYQYRGLIITCDHEWDAGVFMMWVELPQGLNYKFKENDPGDLPYKHQFYAGDMVGTDCVPYFQSTITQIMDYIDQYYEYFEPKIKDNNI